MPPLVSIADAVRVLAILEPADDSTRAAMLEHLGFEAGGNVDPAFRSSPTARPTPPPAAPPPAQPVADPPTADGVTDGDALAGLPLLTPIAGPPEPADQPWGDVLPLAEEAIGRGALPPKHQPLFIRSVARSMLLQTVRTNLEVDELDVDHAVDTLARRLLVTALPRRHERSLVRGVQVLVDRAEAMEPFHLDVDCMIHDVEALFGPARVQRLWFRDSIVHGVGPGPVWSWGRYVPPSPRTPLLVLTALGIGVGVQDAREGWGELSRLLRSRGSAVVMLVPYPRRRWPPIVARVVRIVQWDRRRWGYRG